MSRLSAAQRTGSLAVLAAMALAVLDTGIANVAVPQLAVRFDAVPSQALLIVGAYQAALLAALLPAAHVGERLGHRFVFAAGILLHCGAALACALAPSLALLIAARTVQGLGAAAVMALGVALLGTALGRERLGAAIAWNALIVAISSAAGPVAGALILSVAPWPWLFLAGLPLGLTALIAARALPETPGSRKPIDHAAIALHAAGVILFVAACRLAEARPLLALGAAGSAAALLALLVRRTRGRPAPLLPSDLLGRPGFLAQACASICCFVGQSIGLVALSFHLQSGPAREMATTALVLACWPIGAAAASFSAQRMKGDARQCLAGGAILAAGMLLLAGAPARGGTAAAAASATLCGIGFGLFQLGNNRRLFLAAPAERSAAAGGLQGTARLTGQVTGTLIMALIFAWQPGALAPRGGLAVGAAFALAAGLIAWSLRAAETGPTSPRPIRP